MPNYFNFNSRDNEKRYLRLDVDRWKRAAQTQKKKRTEAEHNSKEWQKKYQELEKENQTLRNEKDEIKRQRDMYKNMLFKKNVEHLSLSDNSMLEELTPKKKRGGQKGHKGYGRTLPANINFFKRIFMKKCPDCQSLLKRSKAVVTHTVEDIPALSVVKPIVTQYSIERQWCNHCKKEITVKPVEVIAGSKLGINLILFIMIHKYGAKTTLDSIVFLLNHQYGVIISKSAVINILKRTKQWLGLQYQTLKAEIRASPVIHADETGWRIEGLNKWVWAFLSKDAVCYQIEETRGKGVPEEFFKDSVNSTVLIHDDYAGYQKLPFNHQSCWAHMLRKSHEAVEQPVVSREMKLVHKELKTIYKTLDQKIKLPFNRGERKTIYKSLLKKIGAINDRDFKHEDAIRIQTRIKNQNKNLLTALLHINVPLTNNHAERNIRPLVVTRKISGGSRSVDGALTHMVNMSIFQTIKLKNQPLVSTLKKQLLNGIVGKN